ncbi:unnamed protein product [Penicillium manginii]
MFFKPFTGLLALGALISASVLPPTNEQAILSNPSSHSHHEHQENAFTRPTWFESALLARRMLALSSSGVISTVFPDPIPPNSRTPASVAGLPIGLREYIADCDRALPDKLSFGDNGDPTILALRIATTFRNIGAGSNVTLELDWWEHLEEAVPVYPGLPRSPAALPRVTLFGYLDPLPSLSHHDAVWLPGASRSPHASFWARLIVTQAYWIGGFGDVQQIGWMDVTEWKGIRQWSSSVGDGRGWEDVRLPGEKQR